VDGAMSERVPAPSRAAFPYFVTIPTRWSDNDMFGHLNNVEYYRFFEVVVIAFFMERAGIDMFNDQTVTFAAETMCRFRKPLSFPEVVEGAMRVEHLGTSSVRYGLALFRKGEDEPAADGHWVHVFVDRQTQKPVPIPAHVRAAFEAIQT
jgi:acyl-CoA thioester hydrolase